MPAAASINRRRGQPAPTPIAGQTIGPSPGHDGAGDEAADRALDGLLRADRRRQRPAAQGAAAEVLRRIAGHNREKRQEQRGRRPSASRISAGEAERKRRRRAPAAAPPPPPAARPRRDGRGRPQLRRRHDRAAPSTSSRGTPVPSAAKVSERAARRQPPGKPALACRASAAYSTNAIAATTARSTSVATAADTRRCRRPLAGERPRK